MPNHLIMKQMKRYVCYDAFDKTLTWTSFIDNSNELEQHYCQIKGSWPVWDDYFGNHGSQPWRRLPQGKSPGLLNPSVALVDFDNWISKKKFTENDNVADSVTLVSEFKELAIADTNVLEIKPGEFIQFERKGYYFCNKETDGVHKFFKIPDGHAAGIASKAGTLAMGTNPCPGQIPCGGGVVQITCHICVSSWKNLRRWSQSRGCIAHPFHSLFRPEHILHTVMSATRQGTWISTLMECILMFLIQMDQIY